MMDLKELIDNFTGRLTELRDEDGRPLRDRRTISLHHSLTSLNTTSIALSDVLISSGLENSADFEPAIQRILSDSETIIKNLRDLLDRALEIHQDRPSSFRYINPDRAARHPLSALFQNKKYALRIKQIAYTKAVLSLLTAASIHINARAYQSRSSEEIEIVTARQREIILEERRAREELINEENKPENRHASPPHTSSWLNAFRWNPDGDLPLDGVAKQWFGVARPQTLQLTWTGNSLNEAQLGAWVDARLNARMTEMNSNYDQALDEMNREHRHAIKEMNRRHDHAMHRLRDDMEEATRQNEKSLEKIDALERCLAAVEASNKRLESEIFDLRTANERLLADKELLQRKLQAADNDPDALSKLRREVAELKAQVKDHNQNIIRLETDNATLTAKATDAQAKLFRMQNRPVRERENTTRGRCPPSTPVVIPNQQRNRDPSPAISHRSSRTSHSTMNYSQPSNSSYTHINETDSRASSQRRRTPSRSSSQYSSTRRYDRNSGEGETRIFGTVHLVEENKRGRTSFFSLTRIIGRIRSHSRGQGRSKWK